MHYNLANCGVFSKWDFEVKGYTIGIAYGNNKGSRIWYYYVKTDQKIKNSLANKGCYAANICQTSLGWRIC